MRVSLGLLAFLTLLLAAGGSAASTPIRTEVLRWSPLDSTGRVKKTLKVEFMKGGLCTDIGYTYVGGIAYRCGAGHWLFNGCWREGPNPTEFVICVGTPWDTTVTRLRSPHLLLYPGFTHDPAATNPWGIVLTDGNRCRVTQGAHDAVRAHGRVYTVDYACERNKLALMREGIRRGRLWHVKAARWNQATLRYRFLGDLTVRRVYFGELPPPLARQNRLADGAVEAAKEVVRRSAKRPDFGLARVRLALPSADWAYVIFGGFSKGWFAVVHRVNGKWQDASAYKPYCTRLRKSVRRQLFLDRHTWNPLPDNFDAPPGEQRC